MMIIKKAIISFLVLTIPSFCFCQKVIVLTKQNGVYTIPCSINGIKRSLVFDTGASTVTISMQLANQLFREGILKDSDIKGFGKSQTASGHIVDNMALVLKDIEISGLHLKNVDAVVIEGQNVPLLLGLSAIQKLGKVTLSGNKLIIDSPVLDNSKLAQIRRQISNNIKNSQLNEAIKLLKNIESQDAAEEIDIYNLALCYCYSQDYNKALMYSQQWMGSYTDMSSPHEPEVCYFMGTAYMGLKSYYEADKWFSKAIRLVSTDAIEQTPIEEANTLTYYYNQKGLNYLEAKAYANCVECFDIATQYQMRILGVSFDDLFGDKIKDKRMGVWLESISKIYAVFLKDESTAERYAIMAALCGNQEAIDVCEKFNINYKSLIHRK